MEFAKRIYSALEPGLGAMSPVQLNLHDAKPVEVEHDNHVRVYYQDLVVEQAQATLSSAMQMPLTDASAASVVSFRQRALNNLAKEQSRLSDLGRPSSSATHIR